MRARCRRSIAALPLVALVACLGNEASAQVITNITSDGTLGTVVAPSATIPNQVDIKGGTVATGAAGNNLFHSFGQFDLGTSWTAAWASPGVTIANVVNRVTGGTASNIYGNIDTSALPGANFYFINPAGVVFGSGFSLNVPAAAHFSTASQIQFADGQTFSVTTPSGSTLTAAAPFAFGFVGNEGNIDLTYGADTELNTAASLDLSAANIHLTNIDLFANSFDLTAMGSAAAGGPVRFASIAGALPATATGEISLLNSSLNTSGGTGPVGNISLRGGDIQIGGGSSLTSVSSGPGKAGTISIAANGLVHITGEGVDERGFIKKFTVTSSALGPTGDAGNVEITGASVLLDGASLRSNAEPATVPQSASDRTERGLAGTIKVTSTNGDIQVLDHSNINTNGRDGNIEINSAGNFIQNASDLTSSSIFVLGDAGGISVTAKNITIGGGIANDNVHTSSFNGVGGTIEFNATGDFNLLPGADLEAFALGDKIGGDISITAGGEMKASSASLVASNGGSGAAGSVRIEAASILLNASKLASTAGAAPGAKAGTINLTSTKNAISVAGSALNTDGARGDITLASASGATISASSLTSVSKNSEKAGTITVRGTGIVDVHGGSTLSSSNSTGGIAGEIALNSTGSNLSLLGSTLSTDGALGNINLTSGSDTTIGGSTLTSESNTSAAAGTISITANGAGIVDVTGTSGAKTISSSNSGTGNAGSVAIKGAAVRLQNADVESTATTAENAQAGKIEVTSTQSEISLAGSALRTDGKLGDITLASARDLTIGSSSLTSESSSAEAAGTISITAPQAINITGISGTKTISSSNTGTGNAGSIAIGTFGAPTVDIAGATITSEGYNPETKTGQGAAGSVVVQGSKVTIHNNSVLSTNTFKAPDVPAGVVIPSSASSNSGLVKVASSGTLAIDTSKLTSNTYGAANAGNVEVSGTAVTLGNAALTSDTYASGNAGDVLVSATALTIRNGALLSSQALPGSTGRSGIVSISAGPFSLDNSIVSTASANPNAAGSITLDVASLLLNNGASVISSNTSSTGGGNNSAGAISIVSKGPVTLAGGSSIQTNSIAGPAGDIIFDMPNTAVLLLAGFDAPSTIQTNSTSATGGEITISDPFAIVLNGGNIQALGPGGGAKVHITTTALIPSSDRPNAIEVNGSFVLETQADNVSNSLSTRDLNVLDASRVLRGQCLARRADGDISQLIYRPLGPYAVRPALPRAQQPNGGLSGPIGGCM